MVCLAYFVMSDVYNVRCKEIGICYSLLNKFIFTPKRFDKFLISVNFIGGDNIFCDIFKLLWIV